MFTEIGLWIKQFSPLHLELLKQYERNHKINRKSQEKKCITTFIKTFWALKECSCVVSIKNWFKKNLLFALESVWN